MTQIVNECKHTKSTPMQMTACYCGISMLLCYTDHVIVEFPSVKENKIKELYFMRGGPSRPESDIWVILGCWDIPANKS